MNEKTILVADDESHILHVVSLKLRNAGFRVLTARDGQEALEMALAGAAGPAHHRLPHAAALRAGAVPAAEAGPGDAARSRRSC